jgi:predicted component of type VI protein secretion system
MAKLVILSAGMTDRSCELTVGKTTIGRVEDNTFQIAESSVSSHHCEVLLRGADVVVHDLNSTNGTFINGEKITESVLKPGQALRLGQVELRLETGAPGAPALAPAAAPAHVPAKKPAESTMIMTRGVSLNELEQGARAPSFDTTSKGFSKKDDKVSKIFWAAAVTIGVVIVVLLIYVIYSANIK